MIEARKLGQGEVRVGAIGLGAMAFAGWYDTRDDDGGVVAIQRALDAGITLIDTAEVYGNGKSEELVGRAVRDRRDQAVVATKAATQSFSHIAKIGYFGWVATSAAEAVTPLLLAALVVAAVVGTSASRKVLEAMTDANFRNWTRRVVLAVGAVYLISGLWALLK